MEEHFAQCLSNERNNSLTKQPYTLLSTFYIYIKVGLYIPPICFLILLTAGTQLFQLKSYLCPCVHSFSGVLCHWRVSPGPQYSLHVNTFTFSQGQVKMKPSNARKCPTCSCGSKSNQSEPQLNTNRLKNNLNSGLSCFEKCVRQRPEQKHFGIDLVSLTMFISVQVRGDEICSPLT